VLPSALSCPLSFRLISLFHVFIAGLLALLPAQFLALLFGSLLLPGSARISQFSVADSAFIINSNHIEIDKKPTASNQQPRGNHPTHKSDCYGGNQIESLYFPFLFFETLYKFSTKFVCASETVGAWLVGSSFCIPKKIKPVSNQQIRRARVLELQI